MRRLEWSGVALAGAVVVIAGSCVKDATGPVIIRTPTDSLGPGILGTTSVNGVPAFRLANGTTVMLEDPAVTQEWLQRYPAPAAALSQLAASAEGSLSLPPSVSLKQYQTGIRDQMARGTCTAFGSLAAIEAAYKRDYGVSLDLSEQYAVHLNKMVAITLPALAPSKAEDFVGSWSGGSATYVLQVFSNGKLGLPDESTAPYIGSANYGDMAQQGDVPFLSSASSQRAVDDFNLSDTVTGLKIPSPIATIPFPRAAVAGAKYRATQVLYASEAEEKSLTWFKTQLAGGHEVVFGFTTTTDGGVINGVWVPGDTPYAGHVMLMIGYDDADKSFLVKNSWGTDFADSGFVRFSYDWVTKARVYEAAVVLAVAPPNSPPPPEQRFLGRWSFDHDGQHGVLDIYRIPGMFGLIQGTADYRLGTYFGPDNVARRVNGSIAGNQLQAYIDWGNSGARAIDDLGGLHFTGSIFNDNGTPTLVAGSYVDNRDNETYGFYGRRDGYFQPTPHVAPPSLTSYIGTWQLNVNNIWGRLRITAVDSSNYSFTGSFVDVNQSSSAVQGLVSAGKPHIFNMLVGSTQLSGYAFKQESGVLAGSGQNGFVAYHYNTPPAVQVTYPANNANLDYDLNLLSGTALHATAQDAEDGNPCCTITWEEQGLEVATGADAVYSFSGPGLHSVTAVATDLDGVTTRAPFQFNLVNAPPTARILRPAHGQQMISGLTYNDSVEAEVWLTCCGKVLAYRWSSSDSSDNFPKNGAKPTNVVFGNPGTRVLTLEVSDNYALSNQDTVTVTVIAPPPTPIIGFQSPVDQDNIQSLQYNGGMVFVNIQILPSSVQGRVVSLVWQGDKQGCGEQSVALSWPIQVPPPPNTKEVWGEWNTNSLIGQCFGWGINGWLRLYVTDPNIAPQHAEVYLYNPVPPTAVRTP
jgi:papain like protease